MSNIEKIVELYSYQLSYTATRVAGLQAEMEVMAEMLIQMKASLESRDKKEIAEHYFKRLEEVRAKIVEPVKADILRMAKDLKKSVND